jgi:hypothetical protein
VSGSFTLVSTGDLAPLYPLSDRKWPTSELWECLRSADLTMVNLESLGTGEALETVVLEVEVEEDHMKEARFLPARMDDNGEPELLYGTDSRAVLRRLVEMSSRLDAPMELLDEKAVIRM